MSPCIFFRAIILNKYLIEIFGFLRNLILISSIFIRAYFIHDGSSLYFPSSGPGPGPGLGVPGLTCLFVFTPSEPDVSPSETVTLTLVVDILLLLLADTFPLFFPIFIDGIIPSSSFSLISPLLELENDSSMLSIGPSGIKFDSPGISSD